MKVSKKVEQKLFTIKKTGQNKTKRVLGDLKKSKLRKIFPEVAMMFWRYERLTGLNIFCFEKAVRDKFVVLCA